MRTENKFKGIWPVINTPFKEDMTIDVGHYEAMLEWYIKKGVDGIYTNCLSSEMYELSEEERLLLVKEAVRIVDGRVPLAATGNFGDSIDQHIASAKKFQATGVDVVMFTVPTFCNNDAELEAYYVEMAKNIEGPLGLYECPQPRQYHLGIDLIETLAKSERFFAYKETSCDINKIKKIIAVCKGTPLALLQANVPFMLEAITAGAQGSMNIVTNWLPELAVKVAKGDPADSDIIRLNKILCTLEMTQRSINAIGIKYLMGKRGLPVRALTRYNHTLSMEVKHSLDQISSLWFKEDGELQLNI